MAGGSLLALLDDIASILDDVSVMTKVAAKKTAGVLGDDLALNAEQVAGVSADRELPVVWAVAKGSLVNKLILVPTALLLSFFVPKLVVPLLLLGGAYLCFEGVEKIAHKLLHSKDKGKVAEETALEGCSTEKEKIKGAIRTDFILSAEIIVIALGTVAEASIAKQAMVVSGIAAVMTVGVYGLVGVIVKLDDLGLYLYGRRERAGGGFFKGAGLALLWLSPALMKFLSVAGTAAMFLVGGGIVVHSVDYFHHLAPAIESLFSLVPAFAKAGPLLAGTIASLLAGIGTGALAFAGAAVFKKLKAGRG